MRPPKVQIYSPNTNLTSHNDRAGYIEVTNIDLVNLKPVYCAVVIKFPNDKMCFENNLLLLLVLSFRESMQQSGTPLGTKYQRITVEANSFLDIRTTLLGGQG